MIFGYKLILRPRIEMVKVQQSVWATYRAGKGVHNAKLFYIQGKPEEVITINPRAAYRSRHGWFLLAAGISYGMYLSFLVMLLVVIQLELALKQWKPFI